MRQTWCVICSSHGSGPQRTGPDAGRGDDRRPVAVGLLALGFAFAVLFAMSFVGSSTAGSSPFARLRRSRADRKDAAA